MSKLRFTLVAAVNSRKTLENNLLASPALKSGLLVETLFKEGAASASQAYNAALDEARGDIVVFVHQDIYLPENWLETVARSIDALDAANAPWGVLGSFGSRMDAHGGLGRVFTLGLGLHGNAIVQPELADSLDEIVLILRKSSGLRFDDALPSFHMYGIDICMTARRMGLQTYAIPAFCVHNTNQLLELPREFYDCYRHVKAKWRSHLPIAASCMVVSAFDGALRKKQLEEFLARVRRNPRKPLCRADDPKSLLPGDFWQRFATLGDINFQPLSPSQAPGDPRSRHSLHQQPSHRREPS